MAAFRFISVALFLVVALLAGSPAAAQANDRGPIPVQPNIAKMYLEGHKFTPGEACTMMTKNKSGVIKRDACGRWYCGQPQFQDIIQLRPNFASEMGCVWRIVNLHCLCQRASGEIVQPQIPRQ